METIGGRLENIEAQRSKDDQRKRRYFPSNLINKCTCRLSFRGFLPGVGDDDATPAKRDKNLREFLANLKFSDPYDLPGESEEMNPETSSAMRAGNIGFLETMKGNKISMAIKDDKGDTILHLAACFGHTELVKSIISECSSLLFEPNRKSQTPLHVAASDGHSAVVKVLIASVTTISDMLAKEGRESRNPYVLKDENGNTPLHLILKKLHEKTESLRSRSSISLFGTIERGLTKTALRLMNADQRASFIANNDRISPLYMAVRAGNELFVNPMLSFSSSDLASRLEGRKSLVHAALKAKNKAILVAILNKDRSLTNERDEEGKTCLSVGASVGYYKGVCYLLDNLTDDLTFTSDDDGFFPIHMAAKYGHLKILKEILRRRGNALGLLSEKSHENILHVAAEYGQLKAIKYILRCYKDVNMVKSINETDKDGNTPLHLATKNAHPKVVSMLTWDETVVVEIRNKNNQTALDIAVEKMDSHHGMLEILTWIPLSVRAPRGSQKKAPTPDGSQQQAPTPDGSQQKAPTPDGSQQKAPTPDDSQQKAPTPDQKGGGVKKLVNTLLLVATLVATMTFTAGFAPPGGYNSSVPNFGMAALAKKKAFQVFLVFNTLAMYSSIITIVALIWAHLGQRSLTGKALNLALPLLGISLTFMSIAFMSGTSAAVSHTPLLPYFILGIGLIFLVFFLLILIPFVSPSPKFSTNPFLRYIFYFPYFLLLWAVGDNKNKVHQFQAAQIIKDNHVSSSVV